jgi:hypothetical protein
MPSENHNADANGDQPPGNTRFPIGPLVAALVLYAVVAGLAGFAQQDQIYPDGVAYIRNAVHLSEGKWLDSVSGYWSPLLSWCMAPLVALGVDGLHAARIALGLWGALLIVAASVFLHRCTTLAPAWNWIVLLLVGLASAQWAVSLISPDVPLGALAIGYFSLTATPEILTSRRSQILAGVLGGLAYLAKSYAFPFFVAHYFLSVILHFVLRRHETTALQAIKALALGFVAFAIVAAPWIAVLSDKYGSMTFSTAAAYNHYQTGPTDGDDKFEVIRRIQRVPPGRITVWETPEILDFKPWSPLSSRAAMVHQAKYIARNCQKIVAAVGRFDLFGLVPGLLLVMPAVRLAAQRRGGRNAYPVAWSWMTVVVYASGYLPMPFEPRYIEPALWPLCCILVCGVLGDLGSLLRTSQRPWAGAALAAALGGLCVLSFAASAGGRVAMRLSGVHPSPYRVCGNKLSASGYSGPVAACDGFWSEGVYVAYHAGMPLLGEIKASSPADVEQALKASGAQAFVVGSKWGPCDAFARQTRWRLLCTSSLGKDTMSVYVAPGLSAR